MAEAAPIAFFLRASNDIDHIVPVIGKVMDVSPDRRIDIFIADPLRRHGGDFRLNWLRGRGARVRHVFELVDWPAPLMDFYFFLTGLDTGWARAMAKAIAGRIRGSAVPGADFAALFFSDPARRDYAAIVHDHTPAYYRALTDCAREYGIRTLALPHSADNFDNLMVNNGLIDPADLTPAKQKKYGCDSVIVSSGIGRQAMLDTGAVEPDQVKVLGSPRFCREWMETLRRITPPADLPHTKDFKVLFVLPKQTSNSFEAELVRLMIMLSRLPGVKVAAKLHTRFARFERKAAKDILFCGHETATHSLIDWADLTLFSASSVILENVILDKPVLFLRRTINNKLVFERFFKSWGVDCRDDLLREVIAFRDGTRTASWTEEERRDCIGQMACPCGEDVLALYAREILGRDAEGCS